MFLLQFWSNFTNSRCFYYNFGLLSQLNVQHIRALGLSYVGGPQGRVDPPTSTRTQVVDPDPHEHVHARGGGGVEPFEAVGPVALVGVYAYTHINTHKHPVALKGVYAYTHTRAHTHAQTHTNTHA